MNQDERHPVDLLSDEFAERIRAGENPSIEEYVKRHPEYEEMIKAIFPSIELVERVSKRESSARANTPYDSSSPLFAKQPERLGDFRILREIGRGGMGIVYEAIQLSLKRRVALKVVGALGSDRQRERFRREAEAAASLHHTNIVPVFGTGEENGVQYYAMQLIEGVTLADVLHFLHGEGEQASVASAGNSSLAFRRRNLIDVVTLLLSNKTKEPIRSQSSLLATSPQDHQRTEVMLAPPQLPESQSNAQISISQRLKSRDESVSPLQKPMRDDYFRSVAHIVLDAANALQYAHHQGILHRDIKPGNLIVDREGTVWIADFGLASREETDAMTLTGEIVGTLKYMAPEQIRGNADARTDIFSLGLTLYELLTLHAAIEHPKTRLVPNASQSIRNPRAYRPEIPKDLETITLKACSFDPSHRYQSASDFEEDLRRFLEDRPILARPITSIERMGRWAVRNPLIATLSTASLLLLLSVVGILYIGNRQLEEALLDKKQEFDRAEENLHAKTLALESTERERSRAERNLDLAIQAFESVVDNIASRGGSIESAIADLADDDTQSFADTTLSNADVVLLETLLSFFDQFAKENAKDLSLEAALARKRVGSIQHRLGRLDDAAKSFGQALEALTILEKSSQSSDLLYERVEIMNDLLKIAIQRGDAPKSIELYQEARRSLERSPAKNSPEGKFAMVKVLNNIASVGSKFSRELRPRGRGPLGRLPPKEDSPLFGNPRLRKEAEANQEALKILDELLTLDPKSVPYRVAYAQALKAETRIASANNDIKRAEESLTKAVGIFEQLLRDYPGSNPYTYELADTLGTSIAYHPSELPRFNRALELCKELIESNPSISDYRDLHARVLSKIASLQVGIGRRERALETIQQAIEIQKKLAEQFPDVLHYQVALVQSLHQSADLHLELKHPERARQDLEQAITILEKSQKLSRLGNIIQSYLQRLRDRQKSLEGK